MVKAQNSENEYHGIWPHHSREIDGETLETVTHFILAGSKITVDTVTDFIFLGSKITADGDCSHEIKRHSFKGKL